MNKVWLQNNILKKKQNKNKTKQKQTNKQKTNLHQVLM